MAHMFSMLRCENRVMNWLLDPEFPFNTGIGTVPSELFANNSHLFSVDLSNDGMAAVPATLLHHSPAISQLVLQSNRILTLPSQFFHASRSNQMFVDLSFNRLSTLPESAFFGLAGRPGPTLTMYGVLGWVPLLLSRGLCVVMLLFGASAVT